MKAQTTPIHRSTTRVPQPRTLWGNAWCRLRRNHAAILGLMAMLLVATIASCAERCAPSPYDLQDMSATLQPIGTPGHLLGTDQLGRDLLSRLIYGARISLGVATLAQLLVLLIGMPIGLIAGSGGRWRDEILMRGTDIIYAFPDLLFVIVMLSVLGRNVFYVPVAMGLITWTTLARLVRAQVISLRTYDFVLAAEVIGVPTWQIVLRHILPHMLTPIIVTVTLGVPQFILLEATLSFIGIGAPPPMPSWGLMVNEGFTAIFSYPHLVVIPGSAIALTMLSCTFVGDGLRDALDPRQ